nr:hypothetical protein 49p1_00035 [Yersinia frederiksenii]
MSFFYRISVVTLAAINPVSMDLLGLCRIKNA